MCKIQRKEGLRKGPRFVLNSCMVHTPEQMWMYNFVKCSFCVEKYNMSILDGQEARPIVLKSAWESSKEVSLALISINYISTHY
jgi:hypothetical protein